MTDSNEVVCLSPQVENKEFIQLFYIYFKLLYTKIMVE